eukprot:1183350-Prorocentrum_minimum.AAC.2
MQPIILGTTPCGRASNPEGGVHVMPVEFSVECVSVKNWRENWLNKVLTVNFERLCGGPAAVIPAQVSARLQAGGHGQQTIQGGPSGGSVAPLAVAGIYPRIFPYTAAGLSLAMTKVTKVCCVSCCFRTFEETSPVHGDGWVVRLLPPLHPLYTPSAPPLYPLFTPSRQLEPEAPPPYTGKLCVENE